MSLSQIKNRTITHCAYAYPHYSKPSRKEFLRGVFHCFFKKPRKDKQILVEPKSLLKINRASRIKGPTCPSVLHRLSYRSS